MKVFNMARKKEKTIAFTVRLPLSLTEEIDQICSSNFITRTSWIHKAARELLEKERIGKTEEILAKIAEKEGK